MTLLACRSCGHPDLEVVLSLGKMPLANALLSAQRLDQPEPRYPLDFAFCSSCCLAQITESVSPEALFGEYAYFSSYSTMMLAHSENLVRRMIRERGLGPGSLAMELASNDGYLLQYYVQAGVPVLGIDPARNVVPAAEERGVTTLCAFFGVELAERLRASGRRSDILHANNVLAHVPELDDFVGGMSRVLDDRGVAVIETPYVRDLIEGLEFDTIYHEHLFYYSLTALDRVLRRNGLVILDVERTPIHGGSLCIFAGLQGSGEVGAPVRAILDEEQQLGITRPTYFHGFAERVETLRNELAALLSDLKAQGMRIAAYGAAAKGTVLLNAVGIGPETLEFVADRSPHKQGLYMPGVHVPIVPPERLLEDMPDVVLLLAWNFADEILHEQEEYRWRGGRFLIPLPEPKVI